ncbi:hypothetical protein U0070_011932, partial [Myodes glareolus]
EDRMVTDRGAADGNEDRSSLTEVPPPPLLSCPNLSLDQEDLWNREAQLCFALKLQCVNSDYWIGLDSAPATLEPEAGEGGSALESVCQGTWYEGKEEILQLRCHSVGHTLDSTSAAIQLATPCTPHQLPSSWPYPVLHISCHPVGHTLDSTSAAIQLPPLDSTSAAIQLPPLDLVITIIVPPLKLNYPEGEKSISSTVVLSWMPDLGQVVTLQKRNDLLKVEELKGMSLLVRAESYRSLLLESKINPNTAYQKQQDTSIVCQKLKIMIWL